MTLEIPVHVREEHGIGRVGECLRFGIPIPAGRLAPDQAIAVRAADGTILPSQGRALLHWPDGSVRWLLCDTLLSLPARSHTTLRLVDGETAGDDPLRPARIAACGPGMISVVAADTAFHLHAGRDSFFEAVADGNGGRLANGSVDCEDDRGRRWQLQLDRLEPVDLGPVRVTLAAEGGLRRGRRRLLDVRVTLGLTAGSNRASIDVEVTNPRAARHRGNLWDLGDPASVRLRRLTFRLSLPGGSGNRRWSRDPGQPAVAIPDGHWRLHQESSGGEHWDSPNHRQADGSLAVSYRGYRAVEAASGEILEEGERADPVIQLQCGDRQIAAGVDAFWQNFPRAFCLEPDALDIDLFSRQCSAPVELQGGERKRHSFCIDLAAADGSGVRAWQAPLVASVDGGWLQASRVLPGLACRAAGAASAVDRYVDSIVDGSASFLRKREAIDEYGWRNFGDLYADHEAVGWSGEGPLVSHYNNQYDFIAAAGIQFLRSGDARWFRLMHDAARHTMDIDIYHTREDKAAYSGGMFWHTDHYVDAGTATHRTYSRQNVPADGDYGGGPSNEHNYSSGLALWYLLSGDEGARAAVLGLADWVVAMDDGSRSWLAILDSRPTGKASSTVSPDYHGPGRGAGNSVNTLLDAWQLSGESRYLQAAERLVARCIHPADDIAVRQLDEPEYRWSYLVFLQVLGKYLDLKSQAGLIDREFYYARDSLLHYADWMLEHERPYRDLADKLLLPTETWSAQDIRKSHVLHLAANCSRGAARERLAARAREFAVRSLEDLLSFDTAYLTRPQVIMAAWAHCNDYYEKLGYADENGAPHASAHGHDFGEPQPFVPQRRLVGLFAPRGTGWFRLELFDVLLDRLAGRRRGPGAGA